MNESKFTPGPWRTDDLDRATAFIRPASESATPRVIAQLLRRTDLDKANARLIAAAPEMYAALEAIVKRNPVFRSKRIGAPNSAAREAQDMLIEAEDAAIAALRKARGENL